MVELNETYELLTDRSVFVCECADLVASRRSTRHSRTPRAFAATSEEHVLPDVERLVARNENSFAVERIGVGAEVAESSAVGQGGFAPIGKR